jgi:hypothetical protein
MQNDIEQGTASSMIDDFIGWSIFQIDSYPGLTA